MSRASIWRADREETPVLTRHNASRLVAPRTGRKAQARGERKKCSEHLSARKSTRPIRRAEDERRKAQRQTRWAKNRQSGSDNRSIAAGREKSGPNLRRVGERS